MNYLDMQRAIDKIEMRWGPSKAWTSWDKLTDDFSDFTAGAFMEALETFYKAGHRYAPSPSEMMKLVGQVQARRIEYGVDTVERGCSGDHVWADPIPTDGDRHRTCVLCGEPGGIVKCDHVYNTNTGRCVYCLEAAA